MHNLNDSLDKETFGKCAVLNILMCGLQTQ